MNKTVLLTLIVMFSVTGNAYEKAAKPYNASEQMEQESAAPQESEDLQKYNAIRKRLWTEQKAQGLTPNMELINAQAKQIYYQKLEVDQSNALLESQQIKENP